MKNFVKTMLAVICGVIILRIIGFIFLMMFIGGLSALGGSTSYTAPRSGGVLDMDMSAFVLAEQSKEDGSDFSSFSMEMLPVVGLQDAIDAIQAAAMDNSIHYILLRADDFSAGMSDLEELRVALQEFRRSGKPVIAYTETPGNGSYYLSSVADKVYMSSNHGGNNMLIGLSGQMMFLKDVLDKVGVHMQLIRHGKYKSAGEMYIRNSASPENREQNQQLVNSAWKTFSAAIADSRDITAEQLDKLIDDLALNFPEDFFSANLVDELVDHETLLKRLCTLAQVENEKGLHLVPFADYAAAKANSLPGRSNVAVIYADGEILDGNGYDQVYGDRFVRIIDELRKDKSVKAVVLRVNSPGGSVSASVKIRTALDLLQQEKPLVASFGNYAASGGYWISNGCQKIYADATTVTGSIGVFSMIPEFSELTKKVGVGIETVGTHKHSDMFSLVRPFNNAELAYMQASVEDIYESFVNLVATSRGKESAEVDEIAQGRVWIGSDALELGLVDEIGTLQDAIRYAAAMADMHSSDEYKVVGYPQPLTLVEELMASFGKLPEEPSILSGTPFEAMGESISAIRASEPAKVYARLPYAIEIR